MCVQKDAVIILWPDGSYADDIGVDVKTTYTGPDRMTGTNPVRHI